MTKKIRSSVVSRKTKETSVKVALVLDGATRRAVEVSTPLPFLNHMLTLLGSHAGFGLSISASGDVEVDDHHLVEDIGICLGQALSKAMAGKEGIRRYGEAVVPMDEALVQAVVDISGRSHLVYGVKPGAKKIKNFEVGLVEEFLLGLARNVPCTIHLRQIAGGSAHHVIEAAFKALGRALSAAVEKDSRFRGVPSTKGRL